MKKQIAVFLRVEGEFKGELRFFDDENMLARENFALDDFFPRDIKVQNIEIEIDCDLDEAMRIALSKIIETDREKLSAKDWEANALREGIEACELELSKLSKHQAA